MLTVQRNQLWNDPILFWQDNKDKSPHNFRPISYLAMYLTEKGDYIAALPHSQAVVRMNPSAKAYNNLGKLHWRLGQLKEAETNIKFALQGTPGIALYNYNYALVLGDLGRYNEALRYAEKAVAIEPQNIQFAAYVGYSQFRLGKPEAYQTMQRVIAVDPQNSLALEVLQRTRIMNPKSLQKGQP